MSPRHFRAPWSRKLKITTGILLALMAVVAFTAPWGGRPIVLAIVLLGLIFSVRGYSVMEGSVVVHRLGWATRFPLQDIRDVEFQPHAMMGSIRTFGIGGFFASIGRFRNTTLGPYRAYATDGERSVVLGLAGGAKVVVTPDRPMDFAELVRSRAGLSPAD
jgi:hypothetical protein